MKKEDVLRALQRMRDESKQRKFQQSVDLTINFKGIDFKKAENQIDVSVNPPNPTGKATGAKTLVFVKDKAFAAQLKGKAQKIIMDEEIPDLNRKDVDLFTRECDVFLAEGPAMITVGKHLGQQLAPKGKMPKLIQATLSSYEQAVGKFASGIRVTNKKGKFMPLVHITVGNEKNSNEQLADNILAVYNAVLPLLEKKQHNIKSTYIKLTMGPPIKIGEEKRAEEK